MTLTKYVLMGATILVGATVAANAQGQYAAPPQRPSNPYGRAYQPYPYYRVPEAPPSGNPAPPSWNYDPYTNGSTPQKAISAG